MNHEPLTLFNFATLRGATLTMQIDILSIIRDEIKHALEGLETRITALELRENLSPEYLQAMIDESLSPLRAAIASVGIPESEAEISDDTPVIIEIIEPVEDILEETAETTEDVAEQIEDAIEAAIEPVEDAIEAVAETVEDAIDNTEEAITETVPDAIEAPIDDVLEDAPKPQRGNMWSRPLFGGSRE